MHKTTTLIALTCLVSALPAQRRGAGDADKAWAQLAESFDKDKDGTITVQEFTRGERGFKNLDRNGDGKLTKSDFDSQASMRPMIAQRIIRAADADKDQRVTLAEWTKFVGSLGEDGTTALSDAALQALVGSSQRGGRGGRGRRGGRNMSRMLIRTLDADQSGTVEVSEVSGVFADLDKNGDEVVAGAEFGRSRERGRRDASSSAPKVGDTAPDFDLPFAGATKDDTKTVKLSSFAGKRPVALIFGSYT